MKTRLKWFVAALAMTGVAGAALGQTSSSPTSPTTTPASPPARHWHFRGPQAGVPLLRAFRQLNLTAAQQQSVKSILMAARQQMVAERQGGGTSNFAALANPGDPNHAAAVQQAQTLAADRIQQRDQIEQQLYGVLTSEQQAQLPGVLANLKARAAQHSGNPT